jgi:hypothetical protein
MRIRALGAIAAIAAFAAPAAAAAPTPPLAETKIEALVTRAVLEARPHDEACHALPPMSGAMTFSDGVPSAELVDQLAILRRPQTEEDRVALDQLQGAPMGVVYRSAVRLAHAADGRTYVLLPTPASTWQRPERCLSAQDRTLRRLTRGASARVRRLGRAELADRRRPGWMQLDHISLMLSHDGIFSGGPGPTAAALRAGQAAPGVTGGMPGNPSVLHSVVRDGVASVTWHFAGGRTATATVQDNIASAEIAGGPMGLRFERSVLYDAAGAVIADVPAPTG